MYLGQAVHTFSHIPDHFYVPTTSVNIHQFYLGLPWIYIRIFIYWWNSFYKGYLGKVLNVSISYINAKKTRHPAWRHAARVSVNHKGHFHLDFLHTLCIPMSSGFYGKVHEWNPPSVQEFTDLLGSNNEWTPLFHTHIRNKNLVAWSDMGLESHEYFLLKMSQMLSVYSRIHTQSPSPRCLEIH